MRAGERLKREPKPTPLRVSTSLACCSVSNRRRMTTGLVLTLCASNLEVTGSPFLYASTASVCTAIAKRQLPLMTSLRVLCIGRGCGCQGGRAVWGASSERPVQNSPLVIQRNEYL